jgi:glycosyltransferase involved in cell wall biosynthesis
MLTILYSEQLSENASKRIRILEPLELLQKKGGYEAIPLERTVRVENGRVEADPAVLDRVDALFLHIVDINTQSFGVVSAITHYLGSHGKALICDMDDHYFAHTDDNPFHASLEENQRLRRQVIGSFHAITVTGKVLKEEMSALNPNVIIVPNMIDPEKFPLRAGGNKRVRIGWCGGPTHFEDLAMIMPAIAKVQSMFSVEVVLFGLLDGKMEETVEKARGLSGPEVANDPYLASFVRMAKALASIEYRHFPSVSYAQYPQALADLNLDIGLCPLQDTVYNRCRSAVKFYHYAAVGTATVAGNVYPYSEECNYLAGDVDDWFRKIVRLVEDDEPRAAVLKEQREFVLQNRNRENGLLLYEEVLSAIPRIIQAKFRKLRE